MHYIYVIKSQKNPLTFYVGYTLNLAERIKTHNAGGSVYTKDNKPWELAWCCVFPDKVKALAFEKYLKSHSGRAFMQKRLT